MKTYYFDTKESIFKRINYVESALIFIFLFAIFFMFFYILLGEFQDLFRALITSFIISILFTLGKITDRLIKNREYIYVVQNDNLFVIMFQEDSYYYDDESMDYDKFIKNKSDKLISDILVNIENYIGVDVIKLDKISSLKEKANYFTFHGQGELAYWKSEGGLFKIEKFVLAFRNRSKNFIVTTEYKDFDDLLEYVRRRTNNAA